MTTTWSITFVEVTSATLISVLPPRAISWASYPTEVITRVTLASGAVIEKLPSLLVEVPVLVPFITTDAPESGAPPSPVTLPVITTSGRRVDASGSSLITTRLSFINWYCNLVLSNNKPSTSPNEASLTLMVTFSLISSRLSL